MDQAKTELLGGFYTGYGVNIPCKVSIINEEGVVVLDTLIRPCVDGADYSDVSEVPGGHRSMENIHGIKSQWLSDTPTFAGVREHVLELCGKAQENDS